MGSVTNLEVSGDNDPEIYQVKYFNHYLYCDDCGSFELKELIEPSNFKFLEKIEKWTFYVIGAYILICIFWMLVDFSLDWFLIFSIVFGVLGALLFSWWVNSKITNNGVVCMSCEKHYSTDSIFFKSYEENPKNFTMSDVPKPLYKTYQIRGETIYT